MPLSLIFIQPGTYTIDDNGIPGDNISVIRDSNGVVIFTFAHPADALNFTVNTPGVNIIVNFTDSLNAANVSIGSLTDAAQSPDSIVMQNIATTGAVTLAATGSITEGSDADAAADIIAGSLIMSAGTGIGTPGNALETQTGALEAESATGGINLANFGNVTIGGLTADVSGLQVATSGDLVFTNFGSILLSDTSGFAQVSGGTGSGNVTLIANGFGSDILTNVNRDAISAPAGNILVQAGQDFSLGAAVGFDNDLVAAGSITINAGRDVVLDGDADLVSDTAAGGTVGNIVITAGRNVSLPTEASTSNITTLGVDGADVIITTGAGGTFLLNPSGLSTITSSSGDVIVNADRIAIGATSGISGAITVTLQPATPGRPIILGTGPDSSFAVELSDAELDRISTPNLIIGSNSAGPVTVISAITPANAPNLIIRSGTDINVQSTISTSSSLRLSALDNVFQTALSTISTGSFQVFVDSVDDDPGVGGIATLNGSLAVTTNVINGNLDADTLNGNGQANILLGFAGNDVLRGFGGADTLDGGLGADSMAGGLGDDLFKVDNAADTIIEAAGEGDDRVVTSVSFALTAGAHVETMTTTNDLGTAAINLTGNELSQSIYGNFGANVLSGGGSADNLYGYGGNDTLIGGAGADRLEGSLDNDTYIVEDALDTIVELSGEGDDRVAASASFVLTAGAHVETISTTNDMGTAAINLTGNELSQSIYGNFGANVLSGGGSADNLYGYGGNDTLIGGAGADRLEGSLGNDFYLIEDGLDTIVELAGEGDDRVAASASFTLSAGAHVETISTTNDIGTAAINLFGNELSQSIYGNFGANVLNGAGGADSLTGYGGADMFAFVTALGGGNVDAIRDFEVGVDKIGVDNAVFTGLDGGALNPNAFRTGTAAQDADDRIIYDSATGNLFYDADGNGAGAAILFATVTPGLALSASDFMVI